MTFLEKNYLKPGETVMEIIKNESVGEKEGRDGKIRSKKIVEWFVVENSELLRVFQTKREARNFIKSQGESNGTEAN